MKLLLSRLVWFVLGLAVLLQVVVETRSYFEMAKLVEHDAAKVDRIQEALLRLEHVLRGVSAAFRTQREYLITGDRRFLDLHQVAIETMGQEIEALRRLVAEDPPRRKLLEAIQPQVEALLSRLRGTQELRGTRGFEAARQELSHGESARLQERIQQQVAEMGKAERASLEANRRETADRLRAALRFTIAGSVLALVAATAGVLLLRRDINERKRTERRFQALIESAPDAMVFVDSQGLIRLVNSLTETLFGYRPEELLGHPIEILLPERLPGGHAQFGLRRDGSEFPVEIALSPIETEEGNLIASAIRDVTERRRLEAEVQNQNRQLRVQNSALERSNRDLDEFADIVSHDLKEPLRGIHNYAGFLLEDYGDKIDEDARSKLNTLSRLAARMDDLIDSILHYSRVGRSDLAVRETNLETVLTESLLSLQVALQERGVEVRIPRPLPVVPCDSVRMGEIFQNLISNAAKYNDKPGKWIEVGWTDDPDCTRGDPPPAGVENRAQESMVFYVRDNGIGVREKHYQDVFRMFRRLNPRDQFGGGTGAGLTIVKKIVERHGGRVWLESVLGEGTTFYFTLPKIEVDNERHDDSAG